MNRKVFIKSGLAVFGLTVLAELVLRYYGLQNPPLYISSPQFEYILAPHQDLRYFGKRIFTNGFSQRSPTLRKGSIRILKVGDSIINGGNPTDHDELASSILSDSLSASTKMDVQVLNISAGSWGPDNVFAYLEEFGSFEAISMVMVFSSHDLHDIKGPGNIVGNVVGYPDKNPPFALYNAVERYVWKDLFTSKDDLSKLQAANSVLDTFTENPGFEQLIGFAREHKIQLIAYLHPTLLELERKAYDSNGKRILEIWKENNLEVMMGIDFMEANFYRDDIHLNADGQKRLAELLFDPIKNTISQN
ncbi:MAG: hypothetical protein KDC83_15035 [Flavobacteriales bacterium]|nr:hypothetical protein [Flavobacteriales bacterium]